MQTYICLILGFLDQNSITQDFNEVSVKIMIYFCLAIIKEFL